MEPVRKASQYIGFLQTGRNGSRSKNVKTLVSYSPQDAAKLVSYSPQPYHQIELSLLAIAHKCTQQTASYHVSYNPHIYKVIPDCAGALCQYRYTKKPYGDIQPKMCYPEPISQKCAGCMGGMQGEHLAGVLLLICRQKIRSYELPIAVRFSARTVLEPRPRIEAGMYQIMPGTHTWK